MKERGGVRERNDEETDEEGEASRKGNVDGNEEYDETEKSRITTNTGKCNDNKMKHKAKRSNYISNSNRGEKAKDADEKNEEDNEAEEVEDNSKGQEEEEVGVEGGVNEDLHALRTIASKEERNTKQIGHSAKQSNISSSFSERRAKSTRVPVGIFGARKVTSTW
jgi:hypothetical protein